MTSGSFDPTAVAREIEEEADADRRSGRVPEGLERDLDRLFEELVPDETGERDFDSALERAVRDSLIDVHPPTASKLPVGGPVKAGVKRLMLWYVDFVAGQVQTFAGSVTRAVRLLGDRVGSTEQDVESLRTRVADLEARLLDLGPAPANAEGSAEWVSAATARLDGLEGRVLCAGLDSPAAGRLLASGGLDVYVLESVALPADATPASGVHREPLLDHLRDVGPGRLGGVVLIRSLDAATNAARAVLLDELARVVHPGGQVVLAAVAPDAWEATTSARERDLAPGRPWHGETWTAAFAAAGFGQCDVEATPGILTIVGVRDPG